MCKNDQKPLRLLSHSLYLYYNIYNLYNIFELFKVQLVIIVIYLFIFMHKVVEQISA